MREILFRGKRMHTKENEWVYGSLMQSEDSISIWSEDIKDDVEVIPETVGQYTGLKDKNGTRIFDGDIISVKNEVGEIYRFEVKFGKCGGAHNVEHDVGYNGFYFKAIPKRIEHEYMLRTDPIYWMIEYNCEIIGNMFDNPELLNQ